MRTFVSDQCFIISPIGGETGEARALHDHVEQVRTRIINAALDVVNSRRGLKLRASRSDMRPEDGSIKSRFIKAIVSDQIVFVVLTAEIKPNVYYELGIAHSAARPVIVLKDKSIKQRQFDIYDIREIRYALAGPGESDAGQPESLPVQEVVQHLESILDREEDELAFERYSPLGRHTRNFVYYRYFNNIKFSEWGELLNRATRSIDLYGSSLEQSTKDHGQFPVVDGRSETETSLKNFLAAKVLFDGIDVTVTVLHPDNPALEALLKITPSGVDPANLKRVKDEIAGSIEKWRAMAEDLERLPADYLSRVTPPEDLRSAPTPPPKRGSFKVMQFRHGLGKSRLTLTDKEVIATPYFYDPHETGWHPAFVARKGTSFYESTHREHAYLKDVNRDHTVIFVPEPGSRRAV